MEYIVTNILLDKYILKNGVEVIEATPSGNVKKKSNILVGDRVLVEKNYDRYIIDKLLDRKNYFIRPPVANVDQMVIVISIKNPLPDYILLDKEIILCIKKNITPIICVNKIDLDENDKEIEYIDSVYKKIGIEVIHTSINNKDKIDNLKQKLYGKTSVFSGNSGVGKSSITSMIINEDVEIGMLGKTQKGKHTTKKVSLYSIDNCSYILDTPGFSSYELYDISHKELKNYYKEFSNLKCEYEDCSHILESSDICEVKRKVNEGYIDKGRYDRYVYIYNKLKEEYNKKYK